MNSLALKGCLALAVALVLFGCGEPRRGPGGVDSSVTIDSSSGDGASGDAAVTDSTVRTDTSVTPTDSSVTGDGSTLPGQCDPSCLATPGAVCCQACGSCGEVDCDPVCPDGAFWDCETGCCRSSTGCIGGD